MGCTCINDIENYIDEKDAIVSILGDLNCEILLYKPKEK